MGLKLGWLGGTPRAPPDSRRVPDGQVAVVLRGALPWVATPTGVETTTRVVVGPLTQSAKALAWSPMSLWPPKPATAAQFTGVEVVGLAELPVASEGRVPLSLSPLPGASVAEEIRRRKPPPPTSVLPDGQLAVTVVAVPLLALLDRGVVVAWMVTSGSPGLAGAAWAETGPSTRAVTPVASTSSAETIRRLNLLRCQMRAARCCGQTRNSALLHQRP